ncbi:MAG: AP endonuclease [Ruminococcaceae bacterium]|nr:AP endonuclease [Oscillospiraceae bacterium]
MKRSANLEVLYTELPWRERFSQAKRDGFDSIEFWDWDNKDLDEVKRLLSENQLKISAMSGDKYASMCDPEHQKEYVEFVKKSIGAAQKINCPVLVVHSNELLSGPKAYAKDPFPQYSDTVKICTMFDTLKKLSPYAEEAGITLVLEALNVVVDHIGNFLTSTQMSAEITSLVGSPNVKILYDAYHMYLNEGKICETLSKYIDSVGYIHIADAPGRGEPGTGTIHYRQVFQHLKKIGYDRTVGFELIPQNGTETAVRAIMESSRGL